MCRTAYLFSLSHPRFFDISFVGIYDTFSCIAHDVSGAKTRDYKTSWHNICCNQNWLIDFFLFCSRLLSFILVIIASLDFHIVFHLTGSLSLILLLLLLSMCVDIKTMKIVSLCLSEVPYCSCALSQQTRFWPHVDSFCFFSREYMAIFLYLSCCYSVFGTESLTFCILFAYKKAYASNFVLKTNSSSKFIVFTKSTFELKTFRSWLLYIFSMRLFFWIDLSDAVWPNPTQPFF